MNFADRTKLALAESIKELMKTIPLDRITVTNIVNNCGTTRQTFYRNFKDKYDLVNWYFDLIVQRTIKQMGVSLTLRQGLVKKFTFMLEDKDFFKSALASADYNNLMNYDYQCIFDFYHTVAKKNGKLDDHILFLLKFYCHGSMDMTADWVNHDMKESPEQMAKLLIDAMPDALHPYLKTLQQTVIIP